MKIGQLTKTAMVVALMMGQVTAPSTSSGYYEEDGDFNVVAAALTGGWGWGLNQAQAGAEGCDIDVTNVDSCMDVDPMPLPPLDPDPWGDNAGPYGDDGAHGGGDSGGGGSETEPELTKLDKCYLYTLEDKNDCYTTADALYGITLIGCGLLAPSGPIVVSLCAVVASAAHTDQKGNCDEQMFEEQGFCRLTPP